MEAAHRIRLIVVDDHAMMRQALRCALECYPNLEVVGEAKDGDEAIVLAAKLKPEVVVMDIHMTKTDGITATRFIKMQSPEIVVLGVSVGATGYEIHAMQTAGASYVMTKDKPVNDLYAAIQRAVAAVRPVVILEEIPTPKESKESENPPSTQVAPIKNTDD